MRLGYRHYTPDRDDLRVGELCRGCNAALDKDGVPRDQACPLCGSTLRLMPRGEGEALGVVVDVRERAG